jgi:hypothetical protein
VSACQHLSLQLHKVEATPLLSSPLPVRFQVIIGYVQMLFDEYAANNHSVIALLKTRWVHVVGVVVRSRGTESQRLTGACRQLWVVPVVNPDGYAANCELPLNDRLIRLVCTCVCVCIRAYLHHCVPWSARLFLAPSSPRALPCRKNVPLGDNSCHGRWSPQYGVDINRNYPTCFEFQTDDDAASGDPCREVCPC